MHDKKEGKSTRKAILDTFERAGTSILMTTVILVLGFGLGFFSEFAPYVNFGVLTAVTLAFALSADLMLLPAILIALDKKKSLHKKLFDS
jgi:predicted RND superfamily exporter protein